MQDNTRLTVKELASYIHCSESSIRKMTREGNLYHFRIGSKILYNKYEIDQWIIDSTLLRGIKGDA